MKVTLTNILLGEATSVNQVIHLFWKFTSEPDGAYRTLPDATVNPAGVVISPSPYEFTTEGSAVPDIDVKAVNACNAVFTFVKVFDGLDMCCPGGGYVLSPDGLQCSLTETVAPTVTQSGVCVACSKLSPEYGIATRFWSGFTYPTNLSSGFTLLSTPYWSGNPAGSGSTAPCGDATPVAGSPPSPVNRQGVWVDTNCDGTKNALTAGAALQFTWVINSPTAAVVFVGIAGDNNFTLTLNGSIVAARTVTSDVENFRFLYLFPVQLISGANFINASFVGDGSVNDMGCMFICSNDAASLPGVTADAEIQYLFQTSQMIGAQPIDIASCPPTYSLDTSGGSGNYICVRVTTVPSTPC